MNTQPLHPWFTGPAAALPDRSGELRLHGLGQTVYYRALHDSGTNGRELAWFTPWMLRQLSPEVERILRNPPPDYRERRAAIVTAPPSDRVQVPISMYMCGSINLSAEHARTAAALIQGSAALIPIDLDPVSVALFKRDGNPPQHVERFDTARLYRNEATRLVMTGSRDSLMAPYDAYVEIARPNPLYLHNLIDLLEETMPLLEAEISLNTAYQDMLRVGGLPTDSATAKARSDKARDAAFHLEAAATAMPYLRELHAQGVSGIPAPDQHRIASKPAIDNPVVTTQNWIIAARKLMQSVNAANLNPNS